jgi:hypothetical protein
VRYERAIAFRELALAFPAGSAERLKAFSRARESFAQLARQNADEHLKWQSRLEEVACLRMLDDYPAAQRLLSKLATERMPEELAPRLHAERLQLALSRGQIDEATSEARGRGGKRPDQWMEANYANLAAYVAAWLRALERRDLRAADRWQQAALDQADVVSRGNVARWNRRADRLFVAAVARSGGSASAGAMLRAARAMRRAGRADQAIELDDKAAARAREKGKVELAVEAAMAAAAIEHDRGSYRAAIDRYRKLALDAITRPRAAEAHLLAVHAAAQQAAEQSTPNTEEYERLLREHVTTWPEAPSALQAWSWLGRLQEHAGSIDEAIESLGHVKAASDHFPEAAEALARCYLAKLASIEGDRESRDALAEQAVRRLTSAIPSDRRSSDRWNAAARAAALAAARISLVATSDGALRAEELVRTALAHADDAPAAWKGQAQIVLVQALAAGGRIEEAKMLLAQAPPATPEEALNVADALAESRERAGRSAREKLASLELVVLDHWLAERKRLEGSQHTVFARRRAVALAETGRRDEAIAALELLASAHPRDGQIQEDLASVLMGGEDAESVQLAVDKWREVAAKSRPGSPRWVRAHYGLARGELASGHPRQARATIEQARKADAGLGGAELRAKFEALAEECSRRESASR